MEIRSDSMSGTVPHASFAELALERGEALHVLHPQQIIAFEGESAQREDKLMNLQGMYRKKKLIRSRLSGPARLMLALPGGYSLHCLSLAGNEDLLFEFRHLLFYSEGVQMKSVLQSFKNMIATKDVMRMKFSGQGTIGIISAGPLREWKLDPEKPSYIDTHSLIAYPHNASIDLSVYGNHLASQHMSFQWKMTGAGSALLQVGRPDARLEQFVEQDSLMKRLLREIVPFGGVWFK
ncbi:AIM24 family protein [Paenibacillus hodogayensis]|uniref:AIM24 family protein n=1 Tax=Paenibacillus hodogayensis TaxID=279208 RepID=A0ABV5VS41_9BACL